MSSDTSVNHRHILTKLRAVPGLAGVRIVPAIVPEDFVSGIVFWKVGDMPDTVNTGARRIQSTQLYVVAAVARGESLEALGSLPNLIFEALNGSAGSYGAHGDVYSCLRQREHSRGPYRSESGDSWVESGGVFAIASRGPEFQAP